MSKHEKKSRMSHAHHFAGLVSSSGRAMTLSLAMIVKNEAENISACLESIRPAVDEMVVVDTGSEDGTPEAARRLGAKVSFFPWCDDFSAARNASLQQATGDYILWLDADDRLDPEELKKLLALKSELRLDKPEAFFLLIQSATSVSGGNQFYQLRLFPNRPELRFEGPIHEQIASRINEAGIPLRERPIVIQHTGYLDAALLQKKSERNLRIIEHALGQRPDDPMMRYHAARTLVHLKRFEEAQRYMREVLSSERIQREHPRVAFDTTLLLGRTSDEMRNLPQAQLIYQDLLARHPGNAWVHFFLGSNLLAQGMGAQALEHFQKFSAEDLNPSFIPMNVPVLRCQYYRNLGAACHEVGQRPQAIAAYEASLRYSGLDPLPSLHALLGLYFQEKIYNRVHELGESLLQRRAATPSTYLLLGLAWERLGRPEKAKIIWVEALTVFPGNPDFCFHLAQNKSQSQAPAAWEEALALLHHAGASRPDHTETLLLGAEVALQLKRLDDVLAFINQLLVNLGLTLPPMLQDISELADLIATAAQVLQKNAAPAQLVSQTLRLALLLRPQPAILEQGFALAESHHQLQGYLASLKEIARIHQHDPHALQALQDFLSLHHSTPSG